MPHQQLVEGLGLGLGVRVRVSVAHQQFIKWIDIVALGQACQAATTQVEGHPAHLASSRK